MVRTRVGYAGGTTANPDYYHISDYTETVQVDYDPAVISYIELLDVFWDSHDPRWPSGSGQYMTALSYHNAQQKRLAEESKAKAEAREKGKIVTRILPLGEFTRAEGYHQKYVLRQEHDLLQELNAIYPKEKDFVDSTAAARINGYLDGYGTAADLQEDLPGFGLSPRAGKLLTTIVGHRKGIAGCPL